MREKAKLALRVLGPKSLGRVTKSWLPVGKKVVIIGGGIQGVETAEFLVKRGRKVTVVEATDRVGMEMVMLQRILLLPWLEKKGAEILTEVNYDRVTPAGLVVTTKDGAQRTLEADTILVTVPLKPNAALDRQLQRPGVGGLRAGRLQQARAHHRRHRRRICDRQGGVIRLRLSWGAFRMGRRVRLRWVPTGLLLVGCRERFVDPGVCS